MPLIFYLHPNLLYDLGMENPDEFLFYFERDVYIGSGSELNAHLLYKCIKRMLHVIDLSDNTKLETEQFDDSNVFTLNFLR